MSFRVVIIDDEGWTRDTIKRIGHWQEYGFRIVGEAADGISGMACIRTLMPDLIITDMKMPGLDGADMLKLINEENISARVIVVSGYDDFHYTRQALCSGAMDYLLKPIKEDEFNALLKRFASEFAPKETKHEQNSLIGVVGKDWLDMYRKTRNDYRGCLESLSEKGALFTLEKLSNSINMFDSNEHLLKILVKVNYDLQRILEEMIISRNIETDIVPKGGTVLYTIRETCSANEIITYYRNLTSKTIHMAEEAQYRKNRINILQIKDYMLIHYAENITLESIANQYHISKEYLSLAFKKEMGRTFSSELTRIKMEKARQLIVEYDLPIQKAAELIGYLDIGHFYKTFKKFYGTSPGKLKEEAFKG